jgi:hypothetical protein
MNWKEKVVATSTRIMLIKSNMLMELLESVLPIQLILVRKLSMSLKLKVFLVYVLLGFLPFILSTCFSFTCFIVAIFFASRAGGVHGCPFKLDRGNLRALLGAKNVSQSDVNEILKYVNDGNYQVCYSV